MPRLFLALCRPLAGTRWRGRTEEEDLALEADLLSDEKERAEHVMLVDLGRNDVGRVRSERGSSSSIDSGHDVFVSLGRLLTSVSGLGYGDSPIGRWQALL